MRIAQILYSGLGGHGSVAFGLAAVGRCNARWQSDMVFFGIEPMLNDYVDACRQGGYSWADIRPRTGLAYLSWPSLLQALNRLRPDGIVLHSVKCILPAALYARFRGIPIVAVEHQPNSLKKPSEWTVSRLAMRLADSVVVLTPEYRDELRASLGQAYNDQRVHLVPNGIDVDFFRPGPDRAPRSEDSPVVVGMAARFSETKRQDLLVEALAILAGDDGPGAWRLQLAGDGETLAALRELAHARGVAGSVQFPGFLGGESLRDWFASLDMYVHASSGETHPTSVLQAMATGLPILGSDVDGIRNLLRQDDCGILARAQTPQALADGLRRLRDDAALAERVARAARGAAERTFSHEAMYRGYEQLLRR